MADDAAGELIYLDPTSRFELRLLTEAEYPAAAEVLKHATFAKSAEATLERIAGYAAESKIAVYGGFVEHELVSAYLLKREGMANEVALIAVAPEHRKRGIGRIMLQDALRRSGKRPLVAETDDNSLGFYKACGFKLVGRRKHPSGTVRYRVGWHAPGLRFKGGSTGAMETQTIRPNREQGEQE
jgi:ribosomal protein S18 acetylase RimI-like enzyme